MNFEWGGVLATRQDLSLSGKGTKADARAFRGNWVVPIASILAPCNLTVRHLCILDILDGHPNRCPGIIRQLRALTYGGDGLWAEGYSYWQYTRWALSTYADRFGLEKLKEFIERQDADFMSTGYEVDGVVHPAPFGDLRAVSVIDGATVVNPALSIYPVTWFEGKMKVWIKSRGVGFNLHTAYEDVPYIIFKGRPYNMETGRFFEYYEGYKKKYPTCWSEVRALLKRSFDLALRA